MVDEKLVSCAPELLYRHGGFYDLAHPLEALLAVPNATSSSITMEAVLFEHTIARRTAPICSASPDEVAEVERFYKHVTDCFSVCAPSVLVKIKSALIWNNMVFTVVGGEAHALYEAYRHPDRDQQGTNLQARLPPAAERRSLSNDAGTLFLGSAGSFNFGHWLMDDFAKLKAVQHIKKTQPRVRVVMSGFNHVIDPVRSRGVSLFLDQKARDESVILDRDVCYKVENLYYPTPISFHPVLKNAHALAFTRSFLLEAAEGRARAFSGSPTLFVNRSSSWPRVIKNVDAVRSRLKQDGCFETDCDDVDLLDQVSLFHNAGSVVGIMGAAMVNQIFCKDDTRCVYLAPSGWNEPFYWDMCDQIGQKFRLYYGKADLDSNPAPYRRNFEVDVEAALALRDS